MDVLAQLDEQQRLVATSLDAPVCVLAGAGTGKTRSITHRIAYGVHEGVYQPDQILALTFTTKASAEMAHRLRDLGVNGVQARTFHSAALRQLQHFWPTVTGGRLPDIAPSKGSLIAKALASMKIEVNAAVLRDIAGDIEWRKVHGYTMSEYLAAREERGGTLPGLLSLEVLVDIHERYEQVKDDNNRIDFEDVLLGTLGMLEVEKRVLDQVRSQYSVFVVDEYQDVSPVQQKLLEMWVGPREDIVVVGDASQTIYTFAGASSHYLLDFPNRYPGAHVIKLETNYRSGEQIVTAANHVMAGRPGALTLLSSNPDSTPLRRHVALDDQAEARYVAGTAHSLIEQGVSPDDIAVLMRFGAQSLLLENALQEQGVSHRVQGAAAFFDEPHVKRAVMEIRGAAVAGVQGDLVPVVEDILFGLGLGGEAPEHQGAERARYEDLVALRELAKQAATGMTLVEFSTMLQRRMETGDNPSVGAVTLSTVHAAKGQEWPVVFMIGLAEGQFPISYAKTDDAIDEERRLFYVGITRARQQLFLSYATKNREGQNPREPSRFLRVLGEAATGA
jgi:DNA helicase-2/ATP-dependent DNA helicase PcrA